MSGNAIEEGLMLQIHNPSHLDPSRMGFLAGALSGIVALILITIVAPNMPRLLSVYLALGVVAGVGYLTTRRIANQRHARKATQFQETRNNQEQETQRKIATMKAV